MTMDDVVAKIVRRFDLKPVITSYSIHYTKLYDCDREHLPGGRRRKPRPESAQSPDHDNVQSSQYQPGDQSGRKKLRITSYNVCYTKLLRYQVHFMRAMRSYVEDKQRLFERGRQVRLGIAVLDDEGAVDAVITSYSIHYTKLYEAFC